MIPAPENDDLPPPREAPRGGQRVQIRLRARVGEADALEAEPGAQESRVFRFLGRGAAEVHARVVEGRFYG